jgi:hypothetical protein
MAVVSRLGDEQPWVYSATTLISPAYKGVFISFERIAKSTEVKTCIWNNSNVRYCSQFRRYDGEFWI